MTTLSEYKAMMEGATDAPWKVLEVQGQEFISAKPYEGHPYFGCSSTIEVMSEDDYPTKSADVHFLSASRNIAPELIRVIELAEEALIVGLKIRNDVHPNDYSILEKAISEIRKLRGE